jgi:hypothetical protein
MTVSFTKVARASLIALALIPAGLALAAGTASADTPGVPDIPDVPGAGATGSGGPLSVTDEPRPAGVPVLGTVQAATGATKVLPDPASQSGSAY